MDQNELTVLEGVVHTVVYQNADNGYAVVHVQQADGEEITCTGYIPQISPGEELTLYGAFVTHPAYGLQFQADFMERRLPETVKGIADYLSSGIVKGIGPKLAERIAERFGTETFDVLSFQAERLTEIRGITAKKAEKLSAQFIRVTEIRTLIDFFSDHRLPLFLVPKLYQRYGIQGIPVVKENPYLLCAPEFGVDFRQADEFAGNIGVSRFSPQRIGAGLVYVLRHNLNNGHTFIPQEKLLTAAESLLKEDDEDEFFEKLFAELERLTQEGILVCQDICGVRAVYLEEIYETEAFLAQYLSARAQKEYSFAFPLEELIDSVVETRYSARQKEAVQEALRYGLMVLTGGPGTGKSTTVRGMIAAFEALGLEVTLTAPTGKAAKRLAELCGKEAKTMHRLLEAGYVRGAETMAFQRNAKTPLETDVVIVDEISMVDVVLIRALISALRPETRLILVGDADQLPPVGPGNFLRDVIASGKIPTVCLTEIFRQAQTSGIVMNAHGVNHGEMPRPSGRDGDFFILHKSKPEDVIATVTQLCACRLPEYYRLRPAQIQVLSPAKQQGAGTAALNRALQRALNPPGEERPEKQFGETIFRQGDRVMQVKNNYDLMWYTEDGEAGAGIFNGDTGEILDVDLADGILRIQFDEKITEYPFELLTELELAYAMTVHKSQGSEFDAVVLALSDGMPRRLLTRNILYTAITRAKNLLVIVGPERAIAYMVGTNLRNKRYSALKTRLLGGEKHEH